MSKKNGYSWMLCGRLFIQTKRIIIVLFIPNIVLKIPEFMFWPVRLIEYMKTPTTQ